MLNRSARALSLLLLLLVPTAASASASGAGIAPDPGFGEGGVVSNGSGTPGHHEAAAIAGTATGDVLVAGGGNGGAAIARYLSDGALDPGFGAGTGLLHLPAVSGVNALTLAGDESAYLLWQRTLLTRITPGGTVDQSFGGTGTVRIPDLDPRFQSLHFWSVAVQPDGRIVVAGIRYGSPRMVVVRLLSDGSSDPSFGSDGLVTLGLRGRGSGVFRMAVQTDGDIVLAGYANGRPALARLLPNGAPDRGFNRNAQISTPFRLRGLATALALRPRGGIVIAGSGSVRHGARGVFALRFGPTGRLDRHFGPTGLVSPLRRWARPVAVLPTHHGILLATTGPGALLHSYTSRGRRMRSLNGVPGVPHRRFSGVCAALEQGRLLLTWSPRHALGEGEIRLERFLVR